MPTGVYPRRPAIDRLLERVERQESGCWIWTGSSTRWGYGVISFNGALRHAHRVSYELHVGAIPDGLDIDHLCRVRLCVNPEHLEPVTRQVNVQRAMPFRRDTRTDVCAAGHPRTPENTYDRPDRKGRNCRVCSVEATRRWAMRRRAAA